MNSRNSWLLSLALVLLLAALAEACPNCKDTLSTDPAQQGLVRGIYYSILFMMSMPFIILTTFGSFAYRSVKRAQAERAAAQQRSGDLLDRG